jgi:large subunit ribosomal protein L35
MPKMKTHKGTARRIRITAGGKIKHSPSGKSHLMSHMSGNKVRRLRRPMTVSASVARKLEKLLGRKLVGRKTG